MLHFPGEFAALESYVMEQTWSRHCEITLSDFKWKYRHAPEFYVRVTSSE
jgi:hypothetical protein